ncbi:katanin p60 ATPase-containing subunit A-like 2 isoform X6 [Falco biarmicus]|uniref:katanin p60 ATPase-containing subunit A-like 2 isoform X6 n=1 Tax=Falco cherrug TaxID=345164 RepID=UPI00247852F5|nr:katanin p60 ATPase-containing subunit A-like 2 isoform X6 [Falco cherrug]XP_055646441.1 katanin p60 ATPase-containing subunit A-like 2 isoform X6 [Falco peregrinus]XP_056180018.1 katanin p60 ATPase-containing subunit A-like 2 isoform X6 [Falco biarmicus]
MELSCQTLRTTYQAREADEMRTEARRKNLLILILHYLMEEGYVDAANALEQETKLSLRGFEVCDNIDLETILMEYESYYFVKFKKYPKITKKVLGIAENKQLKTGGRPRRTASSSQNLPRLKLQTVQQPLSRTAHGNRTEFKSSTKEGFKQGQVTDFHGMIQDAVKVSSDGIALNSLNCDPDPSDIYLHNPNVKWDDIIGLDAAKRLVKEAVVYPIRYPQLFTGILSPWKGLLLYGPPGTGKTLLAKAVATECNTTFFNISASTIVSKWRGDSEKLVRVLFELARYHAPSTIFLDELESVMSQRGTASGGEHEGSRRMKTELLVQMDGLARSDDLVFVLAASNLPWELDSAMLRRLEKRILVDLPSKEARRVMIQHWLPPLSNSGGVELRTDLDYSLLGQETDGYSGSDIKLVCKEAAMRPVRKIFDALENHQPGSSNLPMIQLDTITTADFLDVITHTKPSVKNLSQKYTAWQREFESV